MPVSPANHYQWLKTGDEAFAEAIAVMAAARESIRLEIYHFDAAGPGPLIAAELVRAARRGVSVQVLVDAFGSITLVDAFWDPLRTAGGEVRWFNPLHLRRFAFRDHRKLLTCDGETGFVGGFNIAPDYAGDGVTRGWRDLGLKIRGPAVEVLEESFAQTWAMAGFRHRRLPQLRPASARAALRASGCEMLLSGPGRNSNFILKQLLADLAAAQEVDLMVAYFLPPRRLRRALSRVARRGGHVRMIMAGRSDVPLTQDAARSLYRGFLRAGVRIWEYQPQILHSKIIVIDEVVYVGSSNLDTRSLQINYELMLRIKDVALAAEARQIMAGDRQLSQEVTRTNWQRERSWWARVRQRWARFVLQRLDPYFARVQLKRLR